MVRVAKRLGGLMVASTMLVAAAAPAFSYPPNSPRPCRTGTLLANNPSVYPPNSPRPVLANH